MFLLITFSCSIMVHECVTSKQSFKTKEACIAKAEVSQAKADANGLTRFVLICREVK